MDAREVSQDHRHAEESFETAEVLYMDALSFRWGSGFAYQAEWVGVMTAIAIAHSKGCQLTVGVFQGRQLKES